MKRNLIVAALAFAVFVTAAVPAMAGWVFTGSDGNAAMISNGRMKADFEDGTMIINADGETLTMLDPKKKVYASGNIDELCGKMQAAVDKMMADIPAEQKAMMEKMMAGKKADVKVVDKGDGGEVSGFKTTHFEVHVNGNVHEEIWITQDKAIVKECRPAMMVLAKFGKCMSDVNPMAAAGNPMASDEYTQLYEKGMMVKSVTKGDGKGGGMEISSVEKRDVDENEFAVPDGFKQVSFEQMFGMNQ